MKSKLTKRYVRGMIVPAVLIAVGFLAARTPAQSNAQERSANLRAQLVDIQGRQAELQSRLQQLEEDLKSENIERGLAGVGSVHPEELREARRRQLDIQKRGVQSQLDTLAASRATLETAIAVADAESYRQVVGSSSTKVTTTNNITASKRNRSVKHRMKRRTLN